MGGIVKSLKKAVGGVLGTGKTTQIIMPPAPAAPPAAAAAEATPAAPVEAESEAGMSTEQASRKGKKSLTVRRSNVGGGSGLNL